MVKAGEEATTNMIKVVVDRKKWYRGEREDSMLLLTNGKMCCIGFLARVLKYKPKDIRDIATLEGTAQTTIQEQFIGANEGNLGRAYEINDDSTISDSVREKELKQIGKKMGVRFIFKN